MSILEFIWWAIIFYLFIYMPISHVMNKKAKRKEEKGEKKYILVEESEYNKLFAGSYQHKDYMLSQNDDLVNAMNGQLNGFTAAIHPTEPFKIGI